MVRVYGLAWPSSTHFLFFFGGGGEGGGAVSLSKLNIRKKGTLMFKGLLGNLVWVSLDIWRRNGTRRAPMMLRTAQILWSTYKFEGVVVRHRAVGLGVG